MCQKLYTKLDSDDNSLKLSYLQDSILVYIQIISKISSLYYVKYDRSRRDVKLLNDIDDLQLLG